MLNEGESHWVSRWLFIFCVHTWYEISLQCNLFVEVILVGAVRGCLWESVKFFIWMSSTISIKPPLALCLGSSLSSASHLSGNSHWVTAWFRIFMVHTWDEISLFHFGVEFFLVIAVSSSCLNVIPFLRTLSISLSPPLSHLFFWFINLSCDTHWVTSWFWILMVDTRDEVSLFHFGMEFILVFAETGGFFDMVPLFGSLSITLSPPFGISLFLRKFVHSFIIRFIKLSSNTHWMTRWLGVFMVHIWYEISLLHFGMEVFLAICKSGSFFNVIPFLRSLTVSISPPLCHLVWIIYLSIDTHWMTSRLSVFMVHIW